MELIYDDKPLQEHVLLGKSEGFLDLRPTAHLKSGRLGFVNEGNLLHYAILKCGNLPAVEALTRAGVSVSELDNSAFGNTPLIWAVANAKNTIALAILKCAPTGSDFNKQSRSDLQAAIHLIVAKGYKDVSADGDPLDVSNLTLLQELLKRDNIDPNLPNSYGETALHYACLRRDEAMILALLTAGANPLLQTGKGETARDYLLKDYETANGLLNKRVNIQRLLESEHQDPQALQRCQILLNQD